MALGKAVFPRIDQMCFLVRLLVLLLGRRTPRAPDTPACSRLGNPVPLLQHVHQPMFLEVAHQQIHVGCLV